MRQFAMAALAACLFVPSLFAQRGTAEATFDGKKVSIEYGRPSLSGRDMLAQLQPGNVWRMGMNAGTMLDTEAALNFGGQSLEPGTYRLWARKNQDESWDLIISSNAGWYDGGASNVAVVPFEKSENDKKVETFTIELSADGPRGTLAAMWDTLVLEADFTAE